jgi:hypothetical protein
LPGEDVLGRGLLVRELGGEEGRRGGGARRLAGKDVQRLVRDRFLGLRHVRVRSWRVLSRGLQGRCGRRRGLTSLLFWGVKCAGGGLRSLWFGGGVEGRRAVEEEGVLL